MKITIITLLICILLISGCKNYPEDVKELKEITKDMDKENKLKEGENNVCIGIDTCYNYRNESHRIEINCDGLDQLTQNRIYP